MISWWWVVIAFFAGGLFGVMIYAVCAADNMRRDNSTRWWEDEQ